MDWSRNEAGLEESDLQDVFRYQPRESTVVEMLGEDNYTPRIRTIESDNDWDSDPWHDWIEEVDKRTANAPGRTNGQSGLILILARRVGEPTTGIINGVTMEEWLKSVEGTIQAPGHVRHTETFSGLSEKTMKSLAALTRCGHDQPPTMKPANSASRPRGVRTLPFTKSTFRLLTRKFQTHGTIAKAISRTDVPMFSCDEVVMMGEPALVYNCRTSNAWENDLALSVTHFPKTGLTWAIVYGTTLSMEKEIIKRLDVAQQNVVHPLLIPGIFAELERARHAKLVNAKIMLLEAKIMQLQVNAEDLKGYANAEDKQKRNEEKRKDWLDTVYLKNSLITWKNQIRNMILHAKELDEERPMDIKQSLLSRAGSDLTCVNEHEDFDSVLESKWAPNDSRDDLHRVDVRRLPPPSSDEDIISLRDSRRVRERLGLSRKAGKKIRGRLSTIHDEYEDWIRDALMRVDGMAMATQWASGETNFEIALATRRDSKYMRSIAILTMIFLPGTWLAGVFSMTFFDWKTEEGDPFVSCYLWIYVIATVILTSFTVGCWYYVTVYRPRCKGRKWNDNEDEDKDD